MKKSKANGRRDGGQPRIRQIKSTPVACDGVDPLDSDPGQFHVTDSVIELDLVTVDSIGTTDRIECIAGCVRVVCTVDRHSKMIIRFTCEALPHRGDTYGG